jgi:hypothetical protein
VTLAAGSRLGPYEIFAPIGQEVSPEHASSAAGFFNFVVSRDERSYAYNDSRWTSKPTSWKG